MANSITSVEQLENELLADSHLAEKLNDLVKVWQNKPKSRERSLTITKLQEARHWIEEDMAQIEISKAQNSK